MRRFPRAQERCDTGCCGTSDLKLSRHNLMPSQESPDVIRHVP